MTHSVSFLIFSMSFKCSLMSIPLFCAAFNAKSQRHKTPPVKDFVAAIDFSTPASIFILNSQVL